MSNPSTTQEKISIDCLAQEVPQFVGYLKKKHKDLWVKHESGQPLSFINVIKCDRWNERLLKSEWGVYSGENKIGTYSYVADPLDGEVLYKGFKFPDGRQLAWGGIERNDNYEIPFP